MAEHNINVSAPTLVLSVPSQDIVASVPNFATTVGIPEQVTLSAQPTDLSINIATTNLGEEALPEPTLFKYAREDILSNDVLEVLVQPKYLDTVLNTEKLSIVSLKTLIDTSTTSERLNFIVSSTKLDNSNISEYLGKALSKPFVDSSSLSDLLSSTWSILRTYTDVVQTTDDVLGDANIDDDQYVTVGKGLVDNSSISDLLTTTWDIDRNYTDTGVLSDLRIINLNKGVIDSSNVSEKLELAFTKVTTDTSIASDLLTTTWDIDRNYTDTGVLSDLRIINLNKGVIDSSNVSEKLELAFTKVTTDTSIASDLLTTTWDIDRGYIDTSNLSERINLVFNTIKQDTSLISDILTSTWDIQRLYTDSIDATDDVLGDANIDDDQYLSFNKGILDTSTISDLLSTTWSIDRDYFDTSSLADTLYLSTAKLILESTNTSDFISIGTDSFKLDQSTLSESLYVYTGKQLTDTSSLTDYLALGFTSVEQDNSYASDILSTTWSIFRTYTENTTFSDNLNFGTDKGIVEIGSLLDTISLGIINAEADNAAVSDLLSTNWTVDRTYSDNSTIAEKLIVFNQKSILDIVQTTDDVLGAANIDDDQYVTVGKGNIDSISLAEVISFLFITGRLLIDTAIIAETRTIGKQNYHSSDFVVPYYVGELYTV